jgi:hypothetical protein
MKKLNLDEHWLEILIAICGALMLAITLLAYIVGLGQHAGFGLRKVVLAILGIGMVLAAGIILMARRNNLWKPNIPSVASLRAQIYRHRFDIVLIIIIAIAAGFFFYEGDSLIASPLFKCDFETTWFQGDLTGIFVTITSGHWLHSPYESSHLLFALVSYPLVHSLNVMGIDLITAVRIYVITLAVFWVILLFIVLRLAGCHKFDAVLFTILGMISASVMFWMVVPEVFALGSLSILLALGIVALAERRQLSSFWYTVVSASTMGFTVTNWMVGIIATFVNNSWKRALQITLNALCIVLVLWELKPYILSEPQEPSFFSFLFRWNETIAPKIPMESTLGPGGPLEVAGSFIFHTMVMPSYKIASKLYPLMYTQFSSPGSASLWGTAAVILWAALLALGVWSLFSVKRYRSLRIVIGVSLLGQLALHMVFGEETFLYSLHFVPLLIVLAAFGTQTRIRTVTLVLVGLLVLCAGTNNILQFISATNIVQCVPKVFP